MEDDISDQTTTKAQETAVTDESDVTATTEAAIIPAKEAADKPKQKRRSCRPYIDTGCI